MIRSIRLKLLTRSLACTHHRPASSTPFGLRPKIKADIDIHERSVPYGTEYGAGPSRIPYDSVSRYKNSDKFWVSPSSVEDLLQLFGRSKSNPSAYIAQIESVFHDQPDIILNLKKGQIHSLLNELVDYERPLLAAQIMTEFIAHFEIKSEDNRYYFDPRLVVRVFRRGTLPVDPMLAQQVPEGLDPRFTTRGETTDVDVLLKLLAALEGVRHQRMGDIYYWLTQRLVAEGMYDVAAKIFVGWVEEWITEGRIAEGADPDSFYEGGGPPREGRRELETQSYLHKMWWKGIRTWVLPGEVLSPHDRLDLWHPRKLKLPEKLRRFPFPVPTSPPTVVHHPEQRTLELILDNLDLGRYPADRPPPPSFECSMRACAILASTVLSRTIPWLCGNVLVETLMRTPSLPRVYPANLPGVPSNHDEWAYTAYTHINLAIKSLILSPPQPPGLITYMKAYEEAMQDGNQPLPELPRGYAYMTNRLGVNTVVGLVRHGFRKLKSYRAVHNLLSYAKDIIMAKGRSTVDLVNTVYRELSLLKLNTLAQKWENALFTKTALSVDFQPSFRAPARRKHRVEANGRDFQYVDLKVVNTNMVDTDIPLDEIQPNGYSFNTMMSHLAATSQHRRFEDNVYRVIPYLQFSKTMTRQEFERVQETVPPEEIGASGRAYAKALDPATYQVMIDGLRAQRAVGLAQRVFHLALRAETKWRKDELKAARRNDEGYPQKRLSIWVFTTMIQIWDEELRRSTSAHLNRSQKLDEQWPRGWSTPKGFEHLPRDLASMVMIFHTYALAKRRWQDDLDGERDVYTESARVVRPDPEFFNAMIKACSSRWGIRSTVDWHIGLGESAAPLGQTEKGELKMVAEDMMDWGYQVPPGLLIRLGLKQPLDEVEVERWKGPAASTLFLIQGERRTDDQEDEPLRSNLEEEMEMLKRMEGEQNLA